MSIGEFENFVLIINVEKRTGFVNKNITKEDCFISLRK